MPLSDNLFEWQVTKAGKLMIYRGGELVMIISAEKAAPIVSRLGSGPASDQQVLARATGQYRMGNERLGKWGKRQPTAAVSRKD